MPVLIPGPEVGSDSLKVKFLMIFGRPKTGFFGQISGAPGYIPPIPASYQPRSSTRVEFEVRRSQHGAGRHGTACHGTARHSSTLPVLRNLESIRIEKMSKIERFRLKPIQSRG